MNSIEEKIVQGKLTALEVGFQGGNIPLPILRWDAERLLQTPGLNTELQVRLRNLISAASGDE